METDILLQKAALALKELGALEVYAFGSRARGSARDDADVDLAVRGLPDEVFFKAVAVAMKQCGRSVDLVPLDSEEAFSRLLRQRGGLVRVL